MSGLQLCLLFLAVLCPMTQSRQSYPFDREQQADKSWPDGGTRRGSCKGEWKGCVWEAVCWCRLCVPVREREGSEDTQRAVRRVPRALLMYQCSDASSSCRGHLHHLCCKELKIQDKGGFQVCCDASLCTKTNKQKIFTSDISATPLQGNSLLHCCRGENSSML